MEKEQEEEEERERIMLSEHDLESVSRVCACARERAVGTLAAAHLPLAAQ